MLVAVDDSGETRRVTSAALAFPWPAGSRAYGVMATRTAWAAERPGYVRVAVERQIRGVATRTARMLARRWPGMTVAVVDEAPIPAILSAAKRCSACAVVVGWRGHSLVRRIFTGGSVSRAVVRAAGCAVLVVKGRRRDVRRLVVGIDDALAISGVVTRFVAALEPPRGGSVTLVSVVEPRRLPSLGLLPSHTRAVIAHQVKQEHDARLTLAQRRLDRLTAVITRAGWKAETVVRSGVPLVELLDAAKDADAVVVGARGAGGFEGLLLGSVADGVLQHAKTSVLIVR